MTTDHPVRPWYVCNGNPCTCTKPGRAPDLSPTEAARVAEFEAAPEPPEIRVERVARAMWCAVRGLPWSQAAFRAEADDYREMAAAAIAALSGGTEA